MARGFEHAPGASAEVVTAQQPDLDRAHMMELARSKNLIVRETVAARDDCPLGLLVTLAHDAVDTVRAAVAANPRASTALLDHLANDKHVLVIQAVVTNPAASTALLERLAFHKKNDVREAAAMALDDKLARGGFEDAATPELRDRVFQDRTHADAYETHDAVVLSIETGERMVRAERSAPAFADPDPQDERAHTEQLLTRTAPVRGFRPPVAG